MSRSTSRGATPFLTLVTATSLLAGGISYASSQRPAAGAVTPERLKLPSGPSSVRGLADEPSVDPFYAQLEYGVPFELPAGFGGLSPHLGLTYSGALGNGPVGIGWTLGQARIQRSTRLGVPAYSNGDELEISGIASGRLVLLPSGEYRIEGMGQTVRVQKVDGGFQVDDGTGVRYRLGTSDSSRQHPVTDPTRVLAWLVEQETNTEGETIHYTYTQDQNQVYLSTVTWGPNSRYTATLGYEARPDVTTSYRGGFQVVTAQRLKTVTVSVASSSGTTVRRTYTMAYDPTFSVARLSGITSTGQGGNGSWPALTFTYATPVAPVVETIAGIGTWRLNGNGVSFADVDGDGAADLVQLSSGGHAWLRNRNGTFSGPAQPLSGSSQPLSAVQLMDLDGDARPELVADTGSGWAVWKFSATAWTQISTQWPGTVGLQLKSTTTPTSRFADLNGDGLVDAMTWNNDGLLVHIATRTGFGGATQVGRIGGTVLPATTGRFQDANGDGLDDYLTVASDHIDLYIGHGDGTFEPATRINYPSTVGTISNVNDIELADLDRDGLVDLIKINPNNVIWFRGVAAGGFAASGVQIASPETLTSNVVVAVTDTNGNGSHDIVWSSPNNMWRLDIAGTTTAGMLTEVQNGIGLDTTFTYRSAHALEIADEDAGNGWSTTVPIAMPVPTERKTALGAGETTRQIDYAVRDGFWDNDERRFAGFAGTTVTTAGATPAQTSIVTTVYANGLNPDPTQPNTDRETRGKALVVQVFNGANNRLSATTNTWATMVVSGLPDTPLARRAILQATSVLYDDTTPKRHTDVAYAYDAFGRPNHVVDSGRNDVTGDESVKDTTYADDDTTWVRDRICEVKVSDLAGNIASDAQTLFGDDHAKNALCVVGKGWPRETRALLASENRFITQSATSYDLHGNPTVIVTNGVERDFGYDANDQFPTSESVTPPSGSPLRWSATWDPVLDVMTTVTDPNGHTTTVSYDSLGRYTGTSIDGRPQHVVVEYDWSNSFPKTTTWQFDGGLADVTTKPAQWTAGSSWRQSVEVANGKGQVRYHALRLADTQWIVSDYHEVDPNGRVVFAGRPVLSSLLEVSARPSGIVGDTLVYDPLGRLIEQDLPTGAKRTYSYLAFERTMQDADLAPVHSVLDGQGRAIQTERSLADGTHEIVTASYDPAGRLTTMVLANGAVTRTFTYDTLGRLLTTHDPDLGARTLGYDDGNRLVVETNAVGQAIHYTYDSLGRLITQNSDGGAVFHFHYDEARPSTTATNLLGRLAWTEEPTGGLDVSYDELGRRVFTRRRIDNQVSEATTTLAASGLVLGQSFDDGVTLGYAYDPAGRVTGVTDLWTVLEQDASGRIKHEKTQAGVDTTYGRDVLGLPTQVTIKDADGTSIYDVTATRNLATEITALTDTDHVGLDHTATFSYDGFSRLTNATAGTGASGFTFNYGYDVLHNMTSRTMPSAPHPLGAFLGTYRYGEAGAAPRQLTSIADAAGQVTHTFGYDAAGRQTREDAQTMSYDATDRLLRVDGVPGGSVTHAYGADGVRVKTVEPNGTVAYFFGDGTAIRNGVREHDVSMGSRVVARVVGTSSDGGGSVGPAGGITGIFVRIVPWSLAVAALVLALASVRIRRRAGAAGMAAWIFAAACAPSLGTQRQAVATDAQTTFMHAGFGAGPVVFTDATGHLVEERRYEPFGEPIDAHVHSTSGDVVGAPDLVARDLNPLNKRTEVATGWSDHGARWMAPETGRWLTPDPIVVGPDAMFMAAPWALHPYQYVNENPVAYWDPDGRGNELAADAAWLLGGATAGVCTIDGGILLFAGTTGLVVAVPVTLGLLAANASNKAIEQDLSLACGWFSPDVCILWKNEGLIDHLPGEANLPAQGVKANEAVDYHLHPLSSAADAAAPYRDMAVPATKAEDGDTKRPYRMSFSVRMGDDLFPVFGTQIAQKIPISVLQADNAMRTAAGSMAFTMTPEVSEALRNVCANMNLIRDAGGQAHAGVVTAESVYDQNGRAAITFEVENLDGHNLQQ